MLSKEQVKNIEKSLNSGLSIVEIAQSIGISTGTIYKYKKEFIYNEPPRNRAARNSLIKVKTDISPKLLPYIELIDEKLETGINNISKIYQILKGNGFLGSYSLVYTFINKLKNFNNSGKKMYQKVETGPGEQAQVDWGHFGKVNINGQTFNLYVFVYILSYSRTLYAEFVTNQKQRIFQECHIHAFNKLGVPKKIRYDNVKTVVISRKKMSDGHEYINYNFDFLNFAKYYKFNPEICPPYYPRAKGKVEAGVKYIRYNFMNGETYKKTFQSIDELNQKLWLWLENTANNRIHSVINERPINRWLKEKPYLFLTEGYPPYQNNVFSSRRASQNSMVTFKRSAYWVPPNYARKKIEVLEVNDNGIIKVRFYFRGNKIIEYPIASKQGSWILPKDDTLLTSNRKSEDKTNIQLKNTLNIEVELRDLEYYNRFIR